MTAQLIAETLRPVEALDALIARHGMLRILLAFPMAALRRRRERLPAAYDLSPHLMRDIGLGGDTRRGKAWELG